MRSATAVIIGGGVTGLSTAYQLARKGFGTIIVLEKGAVGDGSSRRAAGIVTGLLWTDTGVLARQVSLRLFRELSEDLPGYRFQATGCLNLFDPVSWRERESLLPLYNRLDVPYEVLSAAEIHARWSELCPDAEITGLFDPLGGYSEPDEYVPALAQRVRELGVEIREGQQVTGFVLRNGVVAGVETTQGAVEGSVVICTTHSWTHLVVELLGWRVPVKSFVHQRYLSTPLAAPVEIPAVNANPQGGYIRPATGNRLLAGGETGWREEFRTPALDFRMDALAAPPSVKAELTANMTPLWPRLAQTRWESERVGLIAFSMDGEPILGPVAQLPGLYIGCAFHSGGFAYNPVAGLLLAEYVADGTTSLDVSAFSPDRFAGADVAEYLSSTVAQSHAVRRRH
jgi:sarcosine oxidase, subunit beta